MFVSLYRNTRAQQLLGWPTVALQEPKIFYGFGLLHYCCGSRIGFCQSHILRLSLYTGNATLSLGWSGTPPFMSWYKMTVKLLYQNQLDLFWLLATMYHRCTHAHTQPVWNLSNLRTTTAFARQFAGKFVSGSVAREAPPFPVSWFRLETWRNSFWIIVIDEEHGDV